MEPASSLMPDASQFLSSLSQRVCVCAELCPSSLQPIAHQAPLSRALPRQQSWSGLPSSRPVVGTMSPASAAGFFTTAPQYRVINF